MVEGSTGGAWTGEGAGACGNPALPGHSERPSHPGLCWVAEGPGCGWDTM